MDIQYVFKATKGGQKYVYRSRTIHIDSPNDDTEGISNAVRTVSQQVRGFLRDSVNLTGWTVVSQSLVYS